MTAAPNVRSPLAALAWALAATDACSDLRASAKALKSLESPMAGTQDTTEDVGEVGAAAGGGGEVVAAGVVVEWEEDRRDREQGEDKQRQF